MEKKNKIQTTDSLAVKFDTLRTGVEKNLIHYLGKPLYDILESGKLKTEMPFNISSKFDIYDNSLKFTKSIGKDYKFDFDFNKKNISGFKDDIRFTLKKDF